MADNGSTDGPDLTQGVALSKLEEGVPFGGEVEGEPVVVVKKEEHIFAIGARCTHYGGPLEQGLVEGDTIRCPWHHAAFELETGAAVGAPAFDGTGCYPVEIDGFHFRVLPKQQDDKAREPRAGGPEKVVIIGAGAAAAAAVEELHKQGYGGAVTMIGADEGPVDRPNLSKDYLAGDAPEEWIPLGSDEHYESMGVQILTGDPAESIDRAAKSVKTESGHSIDYDRLIYATGSEALVPPIGGLESTRHFTLRSFEDTKSIVAAAEQAESAIVLGASFIGLEVAASLRQRGLDVTVVAPESLPLASILGDEVGHWIKSVHQGQGVDFRLGAKVEQFDGGTARLTDASEISFDFVVLGVGVRPRTEIAEAAGLDVDNGVIVDAHLQTNDPSIYAAGDVARFPSSIGDGTSRIEHWVVAQRQAQTVARNMLNSEKESFSDIPFFWSRHFDKTIHYIGYAPNFDETVVDGSIQDQDAAIGYLEEGQIRAVATIGRSHAGLRAEVALHNGDQQLLRQLVGVG